MKKILIVIGFLAINSLFAQDVRYTIDDLLNNGITKSSKSTSQKSLMKRSVNSKIIIDRSSRFSGITNFNEDTNIADKDYFEQALTDVYFATNEEKYLDFSMLRHYVSEDLVKENEVAIGVLNTSFENVNYNADDPLNSERGFDLTDNALLPIEGKVQFVPHHATVISPLKNFVKGDVIKYKFDENLVFSNGKEIETLRADLGDGIYRTIIDQGELIVSSIDLPISESKNMEQTYQLTFEDGTSQNTKSSIYARSISNPPQVSTSTNYIREDETHISKYGFRGYEEIIETKGRIDYRVFYSEGNTAKTLRKPIFILDGFDPGDKRKIEIKDYKNSKDEKKFPSIHTKMNYLGSSGEKKNMITTLVNKGYDVIVCNFPTHYYGMGVFCVTIHSREICRNVRKEIDGGADYIERNSLAFASLIQDINQKITANGSTEKLVILGPSMGAIISRYALAYMEKKEEETGDASWNHNTRLWVSMDGPHLGANIPIGIQALLSLMKDDVPAAADSYNNNLKSITARQFLINQHQEADSYHTIDNSYMNGRVVEQGYTTESGSPFYKRFYKELYSNGLPNSNGFPMKVDRKISIVNGAVNGLPLGVAAQPTLYIRGYGQQCLPWPFHRSCADFHLVSLGVRNLAAIGSSDIIARFKKWPDQITTKATNFSLRGNFDLLSGGFTDTFDVLADGTTANGQFLDNLGGIDNLLNISELLDGKINKYKIDTNVHTHSFIPTASALAISQPQRNWGDDFSEELFCNDGSFTPFDNYFIPSKNENHIELTHENVSWLLQEIDGVEAIENKDTNVFEVQIGSGETETYLGQNILVSSNSTNVKIENAGEAIFKAKNQIVFSPGFHAAYGSNIHALILEDCVLVTPEAANYEEPVFMKSKGTWKKEIIQVEDEQDEWNESGVQENIYPNPSKGILFIDNYKEIASFKLHNAAGKIVFEKNTFLNNQIDISNLHDGLYIAMVQNKFGEKKEISIVLKK